MTHPPVAPVEPLLVDAVQLPHPPPKRRLQRHHKQMEMIPQQTVGKHPPPIPAGHLAQDPEEPLPIPIIAKHQSPLVPPRYDMENTASVLDPGRTHHQPSISPRQATFWSVDGSLRTRHKRAPGQTGGTKKT